MRSALLLSGGMDSIALAWWKRPEMAITINYGQLAARAEIQASKAVCKRLEIPHQVITIDCHAIGSGDMAGESVNEHAPASDWWPYRNQLLITIAAMSAIESRIKKLWIGTVKTDANHLDGTHSFVIAISQLLSCQEGQMTVEAPAIGLTTAELIKISGIPSGVLALAHSCHKANVVCGNCRGCNKYFEVYEEVGYDLEKFR